MKPNNNRGIVIGVTVLITGFILGVHPAPAAPLTKPPASLFSPPSTPLRLPYDPLDSEQARWMKWGSAELRTVHVGMTRAQMAGVLTQAGGFYAIRTTAPLTGVYSLRKCLNFKVSVEFAPVRKPQRNKFGNVWTPEDPKDVITKISKPYLEQVYYD